MQKIDCIGDVCPIPVIKTKKALAEMNTSSFEGLEIIVDNEIAVQNLSKLLNSLECSFSTLKDEMGHFLIRISEVSDSEITSQATSFKEIPGWPLPTGAARPSNRAQGQNDENAQIIVISSEIMGSGDDALGRMLVKGFIFALTQLETLPKAIIFYNSGVRLALKNSKSITDLRYLHTQGVAILSCGMCLNHFNALADLAVGEVTDMYSIVNLMQQATCIIRP